MLSSMVSVELRQVPWGLGALEDQVVAAAISTTVQYVKGEAERLGPPSSWKKSVKSQFLRKVGRMGEQAPQKRIMAFEKIHNLSGIIWYLEGDLGETQILPCGHILEGSTDQPLG